METCDTKKKESLSCEKEYSDDYSTGKYSDLKDFKYLLYDLRSGIAGLVLMIMKDMDRLPEEDRSRALGVVREK